jgi:hypothetical protein
MAIFIKNEFHVKSLEKVASCRFQVEKAKTESHMTCGKRG